MKLMWENFQISESIQYKKQYPPLKIIAIIFSPSVKRKTENDGLIAALVMKVLLFFYSGVSMQIQKNVKKANVDIAFEGKEKGGKYHTKNAENENKSD